MKENDKLLKEQSDVKDEIKCVATNHAYQRAKERMNWAPKVLDKMMQLAFDKGVQHKDTKGTLHRYITKLYLQNNIANHIRIYGEDIYLFNGKTLITLYRLDNRLVKKLKYCK